MRKLFALLVSLTVVLSSSGQLIKKKLPRTLTNSMDEEYAPYISSFGNMMLMVKPNQVTKRLEIVFSQKINGSWQSPLDIGTINRSSQLLHRGGYALNPDGTKMYFTWKKHGGVGQFDIWEASFDGTAWVAVKNIGMPVNSSQDDYCPTISADEKYMMFLRTTGLSAGKPKAGKLMVSEKIGDNTWTKPMVVKGLENKMVYAPRFLADGNTIVYTMESNGVQNFYKSVKKGTSWSAPVALDFLNNNGLEPFVSGSIHTDILYTSIKGDHSFDIYKVKFPNNLKPDPITFVEGSVFDEETKKPIQSIVQVYSVDGWERLFIQRTDKNGDFNLILPQGLNYDVYIQESSLKHTFFSERIDLRNVNKFSKETMRAPVRKLNPGVGFVLEGVSFKTNSADLEMNSLKELDRLEHLLKSNSALNVEIAVFNQDYKSDSIKSNDDLTELIVDTIIVEEKVIDSVLVENLEPSDSLTSQTPVYDIQTRIVQNKITKKTYHNDRTEKQAASIYQYLLKNGVSKYRMSYKGYGKQIQPLKMKQEQVKSTPKGVMIIFQ